jgi:hypothetical protein
VESFRSARSRLKPDGTLIAYHMSGFPTIAAKLYQMIGEAFDAPPGVFSDFHYLFQLHVRRGRRARRPFLRCPQDASALLDQSLTLPHDNWPYLYLKGRTDPGALRRGARGPAADRLRLRRPRRRDDPRDRGRRRDVFHGAGFLLVETKSVTEIVPACSGPRGP